MSDEMKWTCIRHGKDCTACSICHKEELSKSQSRVKELEELNDKLRSLPDKVFQAAESNLRILAENEKLKSELGEADEVIENCRDVLRLQFTPDSIIFERIKNWLSRHEKGEK